MQMGMRAGIDFDETFAEVQLADRSVSWAALRTNIGLKSSSGCDGARRDSLKTQRFAEFVVPNFCMLEYSRTSTGGLKIRASILRQPVSVASLTSDDVQALPAVPISSRNRMMPIFGLAFPLT